MFYSRLKKTPKLKTSRRDNGLDRKEDYNFRDCLEASRKIGPNIIERGKVICLLKILSVT